MSQPPGVQPAAAGRLTILRRAVQRAIRRAIGTPEAAQFAAVQKDLEALRTASRESARDIRQLSQGVQAIIRRLYIDSSRLDQSHALLTQRFGILSQNGEDGLTWAIFQLAGVTNRRFVEIGSGVNGGNSGFLAAEFGLTVLMVHAEQARTENLRVRFGPGVIAIARRITRENVNATVTEHGLTGEIDLFSLDIDGNDYWVWEALDACSPRLVIVEYNAWFGPDRAVVVPYAPKFRRRKTVEWRYYGASLTALTRLAARKGYRLILTEPRGVNAYFLRTDVCPALQAQEPSFVFGAGESYLAPGGDIFASVAAAGLPLIDLDA